jgi:hypothetical protein
VDDARRGGRRPDDGKVITMDALPLIIIFSAIVVIGLIWAALRVTIRRDKATIKADMDEPEEIENYEKTWRDEK